MELTKYKKILFYSVIIFISLIFRIYVMNEKESWYDEWHSIYVANPDLEFSITMNRYWGNKGDHSLTEFYPAHYLILLKIFFKLFGYTDEIGRIFSLIFGVLTIPIALYIFENITKTNKFNFYFGIALAFNLFLTQQSVEIRAHSLFTFFSLVSIALFIKILNKSNKILNFSYFLISLANLTFWPITLTIYFGKLIYLVKKYFFFRREANVKILFINIALIIFFYVMINFNYLFYNIKRSEHYTQLVPSFFINYHFRSFFGSIFLGGLFLIIFSYFLFKNRRKIIKDNSILNLIIYIIISTYSLTLLYSLFRAPIMSPKYVMFILPLIIMWVYANIENTIKKKWLNTIFSLLIITVGIYNSKIFPITPPPTSNALEIISKNNGKYIFTEEPDVFENYIKTKKIFTKNQLILIDDIKKGDYSNIREIWFICQNNPRYAFGNNNFLDQEKCVKNSIPIGYKLNQKIYIKDFLIKSYIKT
jgi:hypothetical protein